MHFLTSNQLNNNITFWKHTWYVLMQKNFRKQSITSRVNRIWSHNSSYFDQTMFESILFVHFLHFFLNIIPYLVFLKWLQKIKSCMFSKSYIVVKLIWCQEMHFLGGRPVFKVNWRSRVKIDGTSIETNKRCLSSLEMMITSDFETIPRFSHFGTHFVTPCINVRLEDLL